MDQNYLREWEISALWQWEREKHTHTHTHTLAETSIYCHMGAFSTLSVFLIHGYLKHLCKLVVRVSTNWWEVAAACVEQQCHVMWPCGPLHISSYYSNTYLVSEEATVKAALPHFVNTAVWEFLYENWNSVHSFMRLSKTKTLCNPLKHYSILLWDGFHFCMNCTHQSNCWGLGTQWRGHHKIQ